MNEMNRYNKSSSLSRRPEKMSDLTHNIAYQIIQASANDNLMPAIRWFTWLIAWTIVVGAILAYAIF